MGHLFYKIVYVKYGMVNRMTRLAMSNSKLRDELDRSRETSNRLTDSIRKLTEDLSTTQRELSEREKMLKDTFLVCFLQVIS